MGWDAATILQQTSRRENASDNHISAVRIREVHTAETEEGVILDGLWQNNYLTVRHYTHAPVYFLSACAQIGNNNDSCDRVTCNNLYSVM